jgi:hypothetical protein
MNRLTQTLFKTLEHSVFSIADIINIEPNANSRYGLLKRAMKDGDIVQIRRGFYTLAPILRKKKINLFGVSNRIYYPSYVSLLSALGNHGWIPERAVSITCATSKNSTKFATALGNFTYSRIPQTLFFCDVEVRSDGTDTWLQARPLKALADYVYVNKLSWIGINPLFESLRIEEESLSHLSAEDFNSIQGNYHTADNVEAFLESLRKDLKL